MAAFRIINQKSIDMVHQLSLPFGGEACSKMCEYLALISPNKRITDDVLKIKEGARPICGEKGIYSNPHITIAKIRVKSGSEAYIIAFLQRIFSKHKKFEIALEDFGSFEHQNATCTIYINIKEHQPFLELANDLKAAKAIFKTFGCQIECLVNNPHLSVVRGLPYSNYKVAMLVYSNKIFRGSFLAEEIVLSKRWIKGGDFNKVTLQLS